ncbi:NADH-quinone oxidoreductase subunit J family protein [Planctomicrobium piriforme]|uniref:NADH-quinone oxidoreductase subunit J n=1 Tax=Planctomicrobium piriforme TaxID=1576369 RepID=A0A1I3G2Q0_9PLAN|nr:NADH-quinone oxidoreductase subunit J [Planctomicrobium piriforme]SFI17431.1 NADH-quinone oxidoreductase subunit J [Planctomicrobium piriforme]
MEQFLFSLYALVACAAAVAVVLSQNVVRMAFYLVISLCATAGLFFLLNADFVGATQLLIYVGGTVVLLIFGVMLTASAPYSSIKNSPAELLQGGFLGAAFLAVAISTVLAVDWRQTERKLAAANGPVAPTGYSPAGEGNTSRRIGIAMLGARFDKDLALPASNSPEKNDIAQEPLTLSTGYLLPFEIVSMHLLVVLVGASYLARAKRRQAVSEL